MTSEKTFQSYFLKHCHHAYRTSLTSGSGFPDCVVMGRDGYARFVELKVLTLGARGDKKLGGTFQLTQPAWFLKFLVGKGKNLFVAFQIDKTYGLLKVTKEFVMNIDVLKYKEMIRYYDYKEFTCIKDLIKELEA